MRHSKRIQSMTGYAHVSIDQDRLQLALEIRSVNSRFLDLHFRLPDELRALEPALREAIQSRVARGKIDVRASLQVRTASAGALTPDPRTLHALAQAQAEVRRHLPEAMPLSVADALRFPGVLGEPAPDPAGSLSAFRPLIAQALDELIDTRSREGDRLRELMLERVRSLQAIVQAQAERAPELLRQHEARLIDRLSSVLQHAAEGSALPVEDTLARVRQEVALHGMKSDVVEELQRLQVHAAELTDILQRGGAVGRKLDFLMQEFNREANTLGSKSADLQTTQASMDLKLLIEQIREQVQNIE
jgi:uncharacterized protein (TIGR00255 family)